MSHCLPGEDTPNQREDTEFLGLCQRGWQRPIFTSVLIDILRNHFHSFHNSPHPVEQQYAYTFGSQEGLVIDSSHTFDPQRDDPSPAIYVSAGDMQSSRLGIGDRTDLSRDNNQIYSWQWTGSHTIFVSSKSEAAVELLGGLVTYHLAAVGPLITANLGLDRWQVVQVGAPFQIRDADHYFAVPITLGWAYTTSIELVPHTPKLRQLLLQAAIAITK